MLGPDLRCATDRGSEKVSSLREGRSIQAFGAGGPSLARVGGIGYRAAPAQLVTLTTASGAELPLTPDHPVFARFVPGPPPWDVLLVREVDAGAVLLAGRGGFREAGDQVFHYQGTDREEDELREELFLLASSATGPEARYAVKLWGARHGIPEATGGYKDLPRDGWKALFREVDTVGPARRLLEELGLDPADPHWVRRRLTGPRMKRHLLVDAVWRRDLWHVKILRPGRGKSRFLGLDGRQPDQELADLASFEGLGHVDLMRRYELAPGAVYRRMRAAALGPGMAIPTWQAGKLGEERIVRTARIPGKGLVYRLDLGRTLGIFVDGVLVGHSGGGEPSERAIPA